MQGGGTRLAAGKAPRAPQRCPIRSAPLCDGRLTPGATPHGPTGQGEERRHHGGALAAAASFLGASEQLEMTAPSLALEAS